MKRLRAIDTHRLEHIAILVAACTAATGSVMWALDRALHKHTSRFYEGAKA